MADTLGLTCWALLAIALAAPALKRLVHDRLTPDPPPDTNEELAPIPLDATRYLRRCGVFRTWARERNLTMSPDAASLRGQLGSTEIVVETGITNGSAGPVRVQLAAALDVHGRLEIEPRLDPPEGGVGRRLHEIFFDEGVVHLARICADPTGVTLTFDPRTTPYEIETVIASVEELARAPKEHASCAYRD